MGLPLGRKARGLGAFRGRETLARFYFLATDGRLLMFRVG